MWYGTNVISFTYDQEMTKVNAMDLRSGDVYDGETANADEDDDDYPNIQDPLDLGYPIDIGNFGDNEKTTEAADLLGKTWLLMTDYDSFSAAMNAAEESYDYSTDYNFDAQVSIIESDGDAEVSYDPEKICVTLTPAPATRYVKGKLVLTLKKSQALGCYMSTSPSKISRTVYFEWDATSEDLADVVYHYNNTEDTADESIYTAEDVVRSGYELTAEQFFDQETPTRDGYTFLGWATKRVALMDTLKNSTTKYTGRYKASNYDNCVDLYAVWRPDAIYVNGTGEFEVPERSVYPFTGDALKLSTTSEWDFEELPAYIGVDIQFRWNESDRTYELYYDDIRALDLPCVTKFKALTTQIKSMQQRLSNRINYSKMTPDYCDFSVLDYGTYQANGQTNTLVLLADRSAVTVYPGYDTDAEAVTVQVPTGYKTYASLMSMSDFQYEGYHMVGFKDKDTGAAVTLTDKITADQNLEILWEENTESSIFVDYYIETADGTMEALELNKEYTYRPVQMIYDASHPMSQHSLDDSYTADGQIYENLVVKVENGGPASCANGETIYEVNGEALSNWVYQANGSTDNPTHITVYYMLKRCEVTYVDVEDDITETLTLKATDSLTGAFASMLEEKYPDVDYVDKGWYYLNDEAGYWRGDVHYPAETAITDDGAAVLAKYEEVAVYANQDSAEVTIEYYKMNTDGETYNETADESRTEKLLEAGENVDLTGYYVSDQSKCDGYFYSAMHNYHDILEGTSNTLFLDHIEFYKNGDLIADSADYEDGSIEDWMHSVTFGKKEGQYTVKIYAKRLPVTYTFTHLPVFENGKLVDCNGSQTVQTYSGCRVYLPGVSSDATVTGYDKISENGGDISGDWCTAVVTVDEENPETIYYCNWYLTYQSVVVTARQGSKIFKQYTATYNRAGNTYTFDAPEIEGRSPDQSSVAVEIPCAMTEVKSYVTFNYTTNSYYLLIDVDGDGSTEVTGIVQAFEPLLTVIGDMAIDTPYKEGATFLGWTTVQNDPNYIIDETATMPAQDTALFAYFEEDKVGRDVVYDLDGGEIVEAGDTYVYDGDTLKLPKVSKKGYTLSYWTAYKYPVEGNTDIQEWIGIGGSDLESITVDFSEFVGDSIQIKPVWYQNYIHVYIVDESEKGNQGEEIRMFTYFYAGEESINSLIASAGSSDYWKEWLDEDLYTLYTTYDASNPDNCVLWDRDYDALIWEDLPLYAVPKEYDTITINLDRNGGTAMETDFTGNNMAITVDGRTYEVLKTELGNQDESFEDTFTVASDTSEGLPTNIFKDGYTFNGWVPENGTEHIWSLNSDTLQYQRGGELTLVAQWISLDYTVTFDIGEDATINMDAYNAYVETVATNWSHVTVELKDDRYIVLSYNYDEGIYKNPPTPGADIATNGEMTLSWWDYQYPSDDIYQGSTGIKPGNNLTPDALEERTFTARWIEEE